MRERGLAVSPFAPKWSTLLFSKQRRALTCPAVGGGGLCVLMNTSILLTPPTLLFLTFFFCTRPKNKDQSGATTQQAEPNKKTLIVLHEKNFKVIQGHKAAVTQISCSLSASCDCDKSCVQLKADSRKRKSEGSDRVTVLLTGSVREHHNKTNPNREQKEHRQRPEKAPPPPFHLVIKQAQLLTVINCTSAVSWQFVRGNPAPVQPDRLQRNLQEERTDGR